MINGIYRNQYENVYSAAHVYSPPKITCICIFVKLKAWEYFSEVCLEVYFRSLENIDSQVFLLWNKNSKQSQYTSVRVGNKKYRQLLRGFQHGGLLSL